jgi:hypothetical protein
MNLQVPAPIYQMLYSCFARIHWQVKKSLYETSFCVWRPVTSSACCLVPARNPGNQPHPTYYAAYYRCYPPRLTLPLPLLTLHAQNVGSRKCPLQSQGLSAPLHCSHRTDARQFTAKSLNRQALKAGKEEQAEKTKLEKVRGISVSAETCV